MRCFRFAQVLIALFVCCLGNASIAQTQRIALVIGNSAYSVKPLLNPANDAQDIATELRRVGFKVMLHTDLGRRGFNGAIRHFTNQARTSDLAVVYFSGHGLQTARENYLIPTDASINDERDIRSEGIALRDLLNDLDEAKVQRIVVILDACRDNPFQIKSSTRSLARGLAPVEAPSGSTVIAFATSDGKVAYDGGGRNGVYTTALLEQMRRSNADIRDLLDDAANAVSKNYHDQRPKIYGDTGAFKGVYLAGYASIKQGGGASSVSTNESSIALQGKKIESAQPELSSTHLPANSSVPRASSSELSLGESEAESFPCTQRLRIPPSDATYAFDLNVENAAQFLHFPKSSTRVRSIERVGSSKIKVFASASEDSSGTFICVLKTVGQRANTGSKSELSIAEEEALNYPCIERLRVPPSASTYSFVLKNSAPSKLVHFPASSQRIRSLERSGTQDVKVLVAASDDGSGTFICVLRG
jgi:hypothetical protein